MAIRARLRTGLRPALIGGAVGAVLAVFSLPMLGETTTFSRVGAVAGNFGFFFVLIELLYASGVVRPADATRRVSVNPWLIGLVAVTLVSALLTQCPR